MKALINSKKLMLSLFVILWLMLLLTRIFIDKGDIILFIGKFHNDFLNGFFRVVTRMAEGIAYLLMAILFLFIRFKSSIAIGITGLTVMVVANILKSIFAYERPFLYFQNNGMESMYQKIEGVVPYVGLTSFPSGHAMAGFALMGIISLYIKNTYVDLLLFFIACLIAFSRIYLGHHFLEDILFGSIIGLGISFLVFLMMEKWKNPKIEKSLLTFKNVQSSEV